MDPKVSAARISRRSGRLAVAAVLLCWAAAPAMAGACADLVPAIMSAEELRGKLLSVLERAASTCRQIVERSAQPDPDDVRSLEVAYERLLQRVRVMTAPAVPPAQPTGVRRKGTALRSPEPPARRPERRSVEPRSAPARQAAAIVPVRPGSLAPPRIKLSQPIGTVRQVSELRIPEWL